MKLPSILILAFAGNAIGQECVDSDGDGWGWDGSKSCRVAATVADACDYSNAVSNDGWGWNPVSGQSCPPLQNDPVTPVAECLVEEEPLTWAYLESVTLQCASFNGFEDNSPHVFSGRVVEGWEFSSTTNIFAPAVRLVPVSSIPIDGDPVEAFNAFQVTRTNGNGQPSITIDWFGDFQTHTFSKATDGSIRYVGRASDGLTYSREFFCVTN